MSEFINVGAADAKFHGHPIVVNNSARAAASVGIDGSVEDTSEKSGRSGGVSIVGVPLGSSAAVGADAGEEQRNANDLFVHFFVFF